MMALLLCTGFIVTQPISVMAEEIMIFAQTAQQQKQSVSGVIKDATYNPQIQISVVSGTKRSIFRQKNKTKRSKKMLHTTLIKPEQKVNEDLCSGFIVS